MKRRSPGYALVVGISLAITLSACATTREDAGLPRPAEDDRIQARVRMALEADRRIDARSIEVVSRDGVVTLSGVVADIDEARRALRIAARADGVAQVVNRLRILPRPSS
jgi:osmotically-inducible protein OsmY